MEQLKTLIILFKAHTALSNQVKVSLEDSSLTINEFAAMEALHTKKSLTTQELVTSVLIPNSSMTYVLDMLLKKNLIERNRDSNDKRIQNISLTSEGIALFEEIYEKHYKHMRAIFEDLSTEEEHTLQELLKKLGLRAERG